MRQMLYCVVLMMISAVVSAQTEQPPPLNPADIFAEGVEWTWIEPGTPRINPVQLDREAQIVLVNGEEFPYPPGIAHLSGGYILDNGMVVLNLTNPVDRRERGGPFPEDVWWLDPETGTYERPPTVCDDNFVQANPGDEGAWVGVDVDYDNLVDYLCQTATDEKLYILPDDLFRVRIFFAPDETTMLITAQPDPSFIDDEGDYRVFAYDTVSETLVNLGTTHRSMDNFPHVCDWINGTQGVICASNGLSSSSVAYYAFDITREDSVEFAFVGWRNSVFRIDDPARYIAMFSRGYSTSITGSRGTDPCQLTIYDAAQILVTELGHNCLPVILGDHEHAPFSWQGDMIYYLTVEQEDATVAVLHSYNTVTLTQNQIFAGEIENILGASPDGRFVVLLMDDNGVIDNLWRNAGISTGRIPEDGGYQVAIVRVGSEPFSGTLLYRSEPIGVYVASQVVWLDEQQVVIGAMIEREFHAIYEEGDGIYQIIGSSLRRINLNDGHIFIDTRLGLDRYARQGNNDASLNTSPDNRYWLRDDYSVIDLYDFQPIPILREGIVETHTVFMNWLENGELEVRIGRNDDLSGMNTYHVRIS